MKFLQILIFSLLMTISLQGCGLFNSALQDDVRERCVVVDLERACDVAAMKGMLGWLMHNVNNSTESGIITPAQNGQVANLVEHGHKLAKAYDAGTGDTDALANVLDEIILLMVQWGVSTEPPTPETARALNPMLIAMRSLQLRQGGESWQML